MEFINSLTKSKKDKSAHYSNVRGVRRERSLLEKVQVRNGPLYAMVLCVFGTCVASGDYVQTVSNAFVQTDRALGDVLDEIETGNRAKAARLRYDCAVDPLRQIVGVDARGCVNRSLNEFLNIVRRGLHNNVPASRTLLYSALLLQRSALFYFVLTGQLDLALTTNNLIAQLLNQGEFVEVTSACRDTSFHTYGSLFVAMQQSSLSPRDILENGADFGIECAFKEPVLSNFKEISKVAKMFNDLTVRNAAPDALRSVISEKCGSVTRIANAMIDDYFYKLTQLKSGFDAFAKNTKVCDFALYNRGVNDGVYKNSCFVLAASNQEFEKCRIVSLRELIVGVFGKQLFTHWEVDKRKRGPFLSNCDGAGTMACFGAFVGRNNIFNMEYEAPLFVQETIARDNLCLMGESGDFEVDISTVPDIEECLEEDIDYWPIYRYTIPELYSPYFPILGYTSMSQSSHFASFMPNDYNDGLPPTWPYNPTWLQLQRDIFGGPFGDWCAWAREKRML